MQSNLPAVWLRQNKLLEYILEQLLESFMLLKELNIRCNWFNLYMFSRPSFMVNCCILSSYYPFPFVIYKLLISSCNISLFVDFLYLLACLFNPFSRWPISLCSMLLHFVPLFSSGHIFHGCERWFFHIVIEMVLIYIIYC